jgi:hypothetical protein
MKGAFDGGNEGGFELSKTIPKTRVFLMLYINQLLSFLIIHLRKKLAWSFQSLCSPFIGEGYQFQPKSISVLINEGGNNTEF